jgi:hypothetical protein
MYVDDIIGVCCDVDVDQDQEKARTLCTKLPGDSAVAEEKTERFLRGDVIGYTIDLAAQRVTISHENARRALFGFLHINLEEKQPVKTIETLASWGSGYATICRALKPFNRAIYSYCGVGRIRETKYHVTSRGTSLRQRGGQFVYGGPSS